MFFKKKCPNCGSNNPKSAKTCNRCGSPFISNESETVVETSKEIQDCDQVIQRNPKSAEAYYKRGFTYQKLGKNEKAIADFDKAIQIDPKFANAYSNRGFAYLNTGQYQIAIADCTKSIELDTSDTVAHLNRGFAYKLQGDKARAISDFEKVIKLSDNPQAIKIAEQQMKELSKS